MSKLTFLDDLETTPIKDFWKMKEKDVPSSPGVYILLSKPTISFLYPRGKSSVFYIGQASNLRKRLIEHLKYSCQAKHDRKLDRYWPRYEYAASFGGRYTFVQTWQGMSPKSLESDILNRFANRYRSFPVANGAGSWEK
jgi:hypothetical protein